jgi:hypothetical protein
MLIVAERAPAGADALDELIALMHAAAPGGVPRRDAATRYMQCREALMLSPHRETLPGFLFQCGSLFRFSDFIVLYDPVVATRMRLVDAAFAACRQSIASRPVQAKFDDFDF